MNISGSSSSVSIESHVRKNEIPDSEDDSTRSYIWSSRRATLQCYMTLTLNLESLLDFSIAAVHFGGVIWLAYFVSIILFGIPMTVAQIFLSHFVNGNIKKAWEINHFGSASFINSVLANLIWNTFTQLFASLFVYAVVSNEFDIDRPEHGAKFRRYDNGTAALDVSNVSSGGVYPMMEILGVDEYHEYFFGDDEYHWTQFIALTTICFFMFVINHKGPSGLEKFTILFLVTPYLCIVICLILLITLPRSRKQVMQGLSMDWSNLLIITMWISCIKRVLIGFSVADINVSFIAVHSNFQDDIMIDVAVLCLTEFLSTFLFSLLIMGFIGLIKASLLEDQLPSLSHGYLKVAVWLTQVFDELPDSKYFWMTLFLLCCTCEIIGEICFMLASTADALMALFPQFRNNIFYVVLGLSIMYFLIGCGLILAAVTLIPSIDSCFFVIALTQSITIFWLYGYRRVCADFHFLMGYKPPMYFKFTWFLTPMMFIACFILTIVNEPNIDLFSNNGIIIAVIHVLVLMSVLIWKYYSSDVTDTAQIFVINKNWGPKDTLLQKSRLVFNSRVITKEHIYRQRLYKRQHIKPNDITEQDIVVL